MFFFSSEPIILVETNPNKCTTNESNFFSFNFFFSIVSEKWPVGTECAINQSFRSHWSIQNAVSQVAKNQYLNCLLFMDLTAIMYRPSIEHWKCALSKIPNTWLTHNTSSAIFVRRWNTYQLIHENRIIKIISTLPDNIPENFTNPPTHSPQTIRPKNSITKFPININAQAHSYMNEAKTHMHACGRGCEREKQNDPRHTMNIVWYSMPVHAMPCHAIRIDMEHT